MSSPGLDNARLPTGTTPSADEDFAGTSLIARLANELFSGGSSFAPEVKQPPAPVPSVPTAVAGLPNLSAPSAEAPSQVDARRESGLSGGFPTASPSTAPVHPVVESSTPKGSPDSPVPSSLPTGGHDPDSLGSYPFGEPRGNGTTRREKRESAPAASPFGSVGEEPQFYFLNNQSGKPVETTQGGQHGFSIFDIETIRRDFPALHQRVNGHPLIYLDNAATTHKPQAVLDATSLFYGRDNSNIHRAAHELSERATEHFEAGREKVRQFLGAADKKEIVFVRGTTEGINLVAQTYGRKNIGQGDEIILTELEHHANIVPWQLLAEQVGATIRVIPINDRGELILEEYVKLLGPRTKIVSVAHVSNSLGTINPIEQIIPLAHARGIPVLVDGAQSTPHLPVNVTALDADFYVFSGHKVFGPTGIGALYGKSQILESIPPYQGGGHMIEDVRFERTIYRNAPEKFEAGTPDIAGVIGLGAAIDYMTSIGIPAIAAYEHELLEYATQALSVIPGLRPIGTAQEKASVLSFVIPGVPNTRIADHLDQKGIAVRAGHHCAMPAQRHFGVESTVRPSLAFYNTHEEVDALVQALLSLPR
ncbi:MAG: SufS family cysteine desulfurase [Verrucomicrobiota bacterium]